MAMSVTYTNFCGRIVAENRGGVQKSYVRDTLGSTTALLDSTHTVTDTWDYWPYGEVAARTGTTATPMQFGGTLGYYTGILSQIYIRARYLMAALGRWLTVDSLWPQTDSYAYAGGNPVRFVDPTGRDFCDVQKDVCLAKVAGVLALCLTVLGGAIAFCLTICFVSGVLTFGLSCVICLTVAGALLATCSAMTNSLLNGCLSQWCDCEESTTGKRPVGCAKKVVEYPQPTPYQLCMQDCRRGCRGMGPLDCELKCDRECRS